MSTKLASRTQEVERCTKIYAQYSDELEIELRVTVRMIGKKAKSPPVLRMVLFYDIFYEGIHI